MRGSGRVVLLRGVEGGQKSDLSALNSSMIALGEITDKDNSAWFNKHNTKLFC